MLRFTFFFHVPGQAALSKPVLLVWLSFVCLGASATPDPPKPAYRYLGNGQLTGGATCVGGGRLLKLAGRVGINPTGIGTRLVIPRHTLNAEQGTVSLWTFTLEDIATFSSFPSMGIHNKFFGTYPFLSDCANPQNELEARFFFGWGSFWHGGLKARFFAGRFNESYTAESYKLFLWTNHFTFHKNTWYNLVITWNNKTSNHCIYANGVLVATENKFKKVPYLKDVCRDTLYAGNPAICQSNIDFYDRELTPAEVYQTFRAEATNFNQEVENELRHVHAGANKKPFAFKLTADWTEKLRLSLKEKTTPANFYVQGYDKEIKVTDEGLVVATPDTPYRYSELGNQVYLWTLRPFEGDIYVEYEFKTLRRGGLSLLMTQASGMNREDFMADYPLRTDGSMSTVWAQDVRNYHWEYYREMVDIRNDVYSGGIMKNPFQHPIGYGTLAPPFDPERWHKLQFLQIGPKLIGAIDGVILCEGEDNSFVNQGPVYNFGRVAIRCMIQTKMLFRNLKIYNRKLPFDVGSPLK